MEIIDKPWGKEIIHSYYSGYGDEDRYCIKEIVADFNLSLQVHFDKTETFTAITDSEIFIMLPSTFQNLTAAMQYSDFKKICDDESILCSLLQVKLPKGAAYRISPGTIHYVKGGSRLLEYSYGSGAMLNSDSTLRLLDWYEPKRDTHTFEVYSKLKLMK